MIILNMAQMTTATTGAGLITLNAAVPGFQTFAAAGATNNQIFSYGIFDVGATWEVGQGTYVTNSSGNFFSRTTINYSSSGGSAINLSGSAYVYSTMLNYDYLTTPPLSFGGRLTLTTLTPVLTTNTSAQTVIFYTPYNNGYVPIYDGTRFNSIPFSEVSVTLDATNVVNNALYDCFMWNNAGVGVLGYGPAWTSLTARSASGITMVKGIQVCNSAITLRSNSSVTNSISINQATYVGTFYGTAAGQTSMVVNNNATGGGGNVLGVFNAYNQVLISSVSYDNTTSWLLATTATWRKADNNAKNSISFVDGIGVTSPHVSYTCMLECNTNSGGGIGIHLNWSSGQPTYSAVDTENFVNQIYSAPLVAGGLPPALGFNVINALEINEINTGTTTFFGNNNSENFGPSRNQYLSTSLMI